jgi:hypothetical protein
VEIGVAKRSWLRNVCAALYAKRGQAKSLFGLSLPQLQRYFAEGMKAAGIGFLGYTPHCLRHGGASTDAADGHEATAVQLRGQWKDARSVARYMKKGALLRQLSRLSAARRRSAIEADRSLRRRLAAEILRLVPVVSPNPVAPKFRKTPNSAAHRQSKRRHAGPVAWRSKRLA